ncbi:PEGA domain-containing protein [Lysobacter sp. N42]|nr:PEGA domain-containing protein [Aliidiomarina sp. B3213]TCZ91789.1 PEGA domain-containing protein [Lysobacter sp. N42]
MRMARLALAVVTTLAWVSAANADEASVNEIQSQIERLQAQYQSSEQQEQALRNEEREMRTQLEALRTRSEELEQARRVALAEMNERYQLVVTDPNTDISSAVAAYQEAVDAHQQNLNRIREQVTSLSQKQEEIQQNSMSRHALVNRLESYEEQLEFARVERIRNEFNRVGSIDAQQSLTCARTDTIQACEERGKQLARQRASREFTNNLFASLSESEIAVQNREASGASVRVLGARVVNSGFSGQGEYSVNLRVELEGQLNGNQACTLLQIDSRYCSDGTNRTAENAEAAAGDDGVLYQLTVRSNVYDDEVFINGVSYGSTPLQLMLPAGEHDIVVSKHGFEGDSQRVSLREAKTLRFELARSNNVFTTGERIQDALYGEAKGPDLVIVPAGRAQVGDQTGEGRANEQPVRSVLIGEMFGMGVFPVTVEQFRDFVAATEYVTEAEMARGCAAINGEGRSEWSADRNWRNPGFEQNGNAPVVCVSYNDALEYVAWLSSTTGNEYRLPTEAQWEYSAKASTDTNYWWGNSIGVGRANCRTCGGQFANVKPSPVGSFPANSWGIYDTVGNVWEWTADERSGAPVLKGGAFNFAASLARAAARLEMPADFRGNYVGMRVIRTP